MKKRRRTTTPAPVENRANKHSLMRLFALAVDATAASVPSQEITLQETIARLDAEVTDLSTSCDARSFHRHNELNQQLVEARGELVNLARSVTVRREQFSQMTRFDCLEALVFSNRLLEHSPEVYPFDADKCSGCHNVFMFNAVDSMNECIICNVAVPVLFQPEDTSADTLILRCTVSGTAQAIQDAGIQPIQDSRMTPPPPSLTPQPRTNTRLPAYRRFLQQYVGDDLVPYGVFTFVHHVYGSSNHLSRNCRSTMVSAWIKDNSALTQYEYCSTRIAAEFCGHKTARLTPRLVDQLVDRFKRFVLASFSVLSAVDRRRSVSFEFLTNRFLLLEVEPTLSRRFMLPRTRSVLRMVDERFRTVCHFLGWNCPRAI